MVSLFYDWVEKYHGRHNLTPVHWQREQKNEDYIRKVREVLPLARRKLRDPVYDVLLVDEGQDLPPEAFQLLPLIARHVTVFSDPTQRLYSEGASTGDALKGLNHWGQGMNYGVPD